MNVMKAGSGVKPCSLGWTLNLAFLRPRWSLLTDNHIGLFLSNQQESLGSSLLGEAGVRHGVILTLTVQPSNEVEQLLLQDLDVVISFACGGGGGAGQRKNHSRESGEGAANDHQQEIHGVSEGHGPSGRGGWHGGVVLLLRCWLICNSGGVVIVVLGEEVVQSLADELLDGAWFVGHRCPRQSLLGCFG
jgi:hypothetical protein